jgi:hypothetical protein
MKTGDLEQFQLDIYDVKDQLKQLIYSRSLEAFAAGDRARDEIATVDDLQRRQRFVRDSFIRSLGGLPASDLPLNPQTAGTVKGGGYTIEKVMFESRPQQWVTANLYLPDQLTAPSAAVLHLCGHNPMAKHSDLYQTVAQHLVRAGLIVLNMDPIGQGERLSYYERESGKLNVAASTREHEYAGKQCLPLGDNIARYFVHDAMRAIDYLISRPEVDAAKIGVTGCSGGGTQTSMLMICDPRVAAAAPAAFIMNRESYMYAGQAQDAEQIWTGLTKLGIDHEDILLSMAPRPTLVMAAEYDFFPIEGTRRTVERTKRFWKLFGGSHCLEYFEEPIVHTYSPAMAKAAAAFFSRHLLGRPLDCTWEGIHPVKPELLWCTASGQVRGDREHVRAVHEENGDRLAGLEAQARSVPDPVKKEKALSWLHDKVFADRRPSPLNPRRLKLPSLDDAPELTAESVLWWSQKGLFNHGFVFRFETCRDEHSPMTIALWARGTRNLRARLDWIRETCRSGRAVLVLDVSGDGAVTPNSITTKGGIHDFYGTIHKLTTDLFWLDDSLAALRTYDVIRALDLVDWISGGRNSDIRLFADGRFGMYGELARVLDERLQQVEIVNGISSIAEWVRSRYYETLDSEGMIIPGMLQYFDLPDLRRWVKS